MFQATKQLRTAVMFPVSVSAIFFALNGLILGQKIIWCRSIQNNGSLTLLWFRTSLPLVFCCWLCRVQENLQLRIS